MAPSKYSQEAIDSLSGKELIDLIDERHKALYAKKVLPTVKEIRQRLRIQRIGILAHVLSFILLLSKSPFALLPLFVLIVIVIYLYFTTYRRKIFNTKRNLRISELRQEMGPYFYFSCEYETLINDKLF